MAWYFYWQPTPESGWELAESRNRDKIIADKQPPFVTVLDLNTDVQDGMTKEELSGIHYKGDLYFDFDADSIEEVIPPFQRFLSKLVELDVDLRQVEIYASGGKGFHVIIPSEMFIENPSTAGYTHLPAIYKEIAQDEKIYVDSLDLRVYSARKGRMFRVTNIKRTNGKYKVPLSVEEARAITAEEYDRLTSAPRQAFMIAPPVHNPGLSLIFNTARNKVKKLVASRRNSTSDTKLITAFGGEFPDSMKLIGSGEKIKEGIGFQRLATQIAITANALGQTEEQMLELCQGLVQNHQSDGSRYNTPDKRRKELLRMYGYMDDNPCYEFSAGGIKSCLEPGTPTPDLNAPIEDAHGALAEDDELGIDDSISMGVRFNRGGIYVKVFDKETKEHYIKTCSELGMDNVAILQDLTTRQTIGYEYDAYLGGQFRGRRKASMTSLNSSNALQTTLGNADGAAIQLTDAQSKAMMELMRKKAEVKNAIVTTVPREGVDVIPLQDTPEETNRYEVIYAGPNNIGVITKDDDDAQGYRLSTVNGQDGEFKSDLLSAPQLKDTPETRVFFDKFFNLYPDEIAARTLGFYLACFLAQPIRHTDRQFPMLQVHGQAGAGKTSYNLLCSNLHFYNKQPPVWAANSVTPFALTSLLQSSGSIPVVFDEFKTRELGLKRSQDILMIMRNNYTGNSGGKGRVNRDLAATGSALSVSQSANVAPLVFLAEEMETQTAVLDRSIVVAMPDKQTNQSETDNDWHYCVQHRKVLGQFGHLLVRKTLTVDMAKMTEELNDLRFEIGRAATRSAAARPLFNNAVIMLGLNLGKRTLSSVFGDRYGEVFDGYKAEIINNINQSLPANKSEPTKVLETLAHLSARPVTDPFHLVLGEDYTYAKDDFTKETCVEIHLRNAWDKYSRHKRSQGEQVLFASEGAFINSLSRHRAVYDTVCAGSDLKGGRPSVKTVRFSLRILYDEELIEEFKGLTA